MFVKLTQRVFGTRKSLGDKIVEIGDNLKETREAEKATTKDSVKELKETIERLENALRVMTTDRNVAWEKINEMTKDDSQDFSIDWQKMKAFSIERIADRTNIGYFVNEEVKEWKLTCSLETHRILVRQFEHYKLV